MKKATILIVEDEAIIAMEIENQLQSLGYKVTSIVDTSKKAIKKAEEDRPDLILMDIRIKGEMDGIGTAEAIRSQFGIPVVFSTAYLDEERIERAKITMPFGYVLKPIQERDLKVTIEMALYVAKVDAERKKVEQISIDNEKQYHDLFDSMLDGYALHEMIFDDDGAPLDYRFLKVNPTFERLTGLKGKDIVGKTVLEILPDTEYYWIKKYGEVTISGNPICFENFSREFDKYYEVNAYRPTEGQFACVFKDVTDQKRAEHELAEHRAKLEKSVNERTKELSAARDQLKKKVEELQQKETELKVNEEKYRLMFENAPIPYQSLNADGEFIDVSQSWLDEFGYEKDEVMGKKFVDFLTDPYKALLPERFSEFKQSGQIINLEFELICKNGKTKNGAFTGKISNDKKGNFERTHCVFTPIPD